MKYFWWKFNKSLGQFWRIVNGHLKFYTVKLNKEYLKENSYEGLPMPINWEIVLKGRRLEVEIGSGHGEVLVANDPKTSIRVGYEIRSRYYRLIRKKLWNRYDSYIYKGNGYESLFLHYKDSVIDTLYILFPDPWHKKRHNKRRPLTAEFFLKVAQKIKKGGSVVVATDWTDYADFIKEEVKKIEVEYEVIVKPYKPEELNLPITHFHQKWVRKGRTFTAFILKKK